MRWLIGKRCDDYRTWTLIIMWGLPNIKDDMIRNKQKQDMCASKWLCMWSACSWERMERSLNRGNSEKMSLKVGWREKVVREVGFQGIERWKYWYGDGTNCWQWAPMACQSKLSSHREAMKTSPMEASLAYVHCTRQVFPPGRVLKMAMQNNVSCIRGRIQNVEMH